MNYLASIGCYLCDRVGYYLQVFMQLQLQVEVPRSRSDSTSWESCVLTSREPPNSLPKEEFVAEGLGCICRLPGSETKPTSSSRTPAWPVLLWFREIKLYPIEKELKSCCFWECYFNVLVQWVGLVVYNSETLEHLWIVREVHYSLSAVRHSSFQRKLQSSHQDAEHYLWPVTGHE